MATSEVKEVSYELQEIFLRPVCIIPTAKDGTLDFEEDVLKQIEKITVPMVVVAVVGLYRTGKSYLMNRLAGHSEGFPLGSTIQSKTKGIWAWCRRHPHLKDTVLLLLDTEGLGDVAKGDQGHDNRIFTLAVLLCNVLVYNMMTAFNQDAVEKLTFISEMSKNIRFENKSSTDKENDQLELILPTFVLCLRDFTLDLEIDGNEISADAYLEDSLQLKPGKGGEIERFNRPRESIRKYFPVRKCFTFDSPGNRKIIKQLEKLPLEDLSETFVEETRKFLEYVYERKPKVLLHSKPVTGPMFVPLLKTYVKAIKEGAVPDVDDAILVVANIENERMANIAVDEFRKQLSQVKLPILNTAALDNMRQSIQNMSLAQFRLEAVFNSEKFEKMAIDEMDKLWEEVKERNLELVTMVCKAELEEVYMKIVGTKMNSGSYLTAGGHLEYKADIGTFKTSYKKKVKDTDAFVSQNVLNTFLEEEADNETKIMMADQKLSEEERKRETERMNEEHKEAQRQQQQMFERQMQEEKIRNEKHQEEMRKEREEYTKREDAKLKLLTDQCNAQREISEKQIQMMREESANLRKEHLANMETLKADWAQKEAETRRVFEASQKEMNDRKERELAEQNLRNKKLETEKIAAERKLKYIKKKTEKQMLKYQEDLKQVRDIGSQQAEELRKKIAELETKKKKGFFASLFS